MFVCFYCILGLLLLQVSIELIALSALEHCPFIVSYGLVLFTGPPPIPAEPVVTPEAAYVSKVQYGR